MALVLSKMENIQFVSGPAPEPFEVATRGGWEGKLPGFLKDEPRITHGPQRKGRGGKILRW